MKFPIRKSSTPFSCTICGKVYAWKVSLRRHLREECQKVPQNVCFCGKRFKQKSSFGRHLRNMHNQGRDPFNRHFKKL